MEFWELLDNLFGTCRHQFDEYERTYCEQPASAFDDDYTSIFFMCSNCGKHKIVRLAGRVLREYNLESRPQ